MTMTNDGTITNEGVTAEPSGVSPRLQEFQAEVHDLKVSGGRANPERTGKILGGLMMLVGLILTIVGYGLRPTRALAIGLSLGVAANLAFTALWSTVEIHWVPSGLETIWLLGNAAALAILARVCLKK